MGRQDGLARGELIDASAERYRARYQWLAAAYVAAGGLVAAVVTATQEFAGLVVSASGLVAGLVVATQFLREPISRLASTSHEKEVVSRRQVAGIAALAVLFPFGTAANALGVEALFDGAGALVLGSLVGGIFALGCGLLAGRYVVSADAMSRRVLTNRATPAAG